MDHIEIIQRLNVLKEQLLETNGGFINRNVKAVDNAIKIIKYSSNLHAIFVGSYFSGAVTGIIITSILMAVFR